MNKQILRTPDGVRDIYNGECKRKLQLQDKLHSVLKSYGYHDIQTPTFEFFSIFGSEIGTTPSRDLYKFFDKEGNTLVLRPDFTPSIARCAATYFAEEDLPLKLCYMGSTFVNSSDYRGHMKENAQCGAELIGDGSTGADAEILAMAADCMLHAGLRSFQISVGHSLFFPGLVKAAGIDEGTEELLTEYIRNKNFLGIEDVIAELPLDENLRSLFSMLSSFDTKIEDISAAREKAADWPELYQALSELAALHTYLRYYGVEKYVSYELGRVSDYHYYTGIIFSAYTFGTGEPVIKGGRYNKLLRYFGKDAPAIGFAVLTDQLMAALSRQNIRIPLVEKNALVVYRTGCEEAAVKRSVQLRLQGTSVVLLEMAEGKTKDDYAAYAVKNHINKVEFMEGEV